MIVDLGQLSRGRIYHLMTQLVIPRPVAWVLTEEEGGRHNLAPFSYFNAVSSQPPLLMISVDIRPDRKTVKDTRRNIERDGRFVIHIARDSQVEHVNASSASLPPGVSEIDELDLELAELGEFGLPRVACAPVAVACTLHRSIMIADGQCLFFGKITLAHVADEICEADAEGRLRIDPGAFSPLSRLGAGGYAVFGRPLTLARPP